MLRRCGCAVAAILAARSWNPGAEASQVPSSGETGASAASASAIAMARTRPWVRTASNASASGAATLLHTGAAVFDGPGLVHESIPPMRQESGGITIRAIASMTSKADVEILSGIPELALPAPLPVDGLLSELEPIDVSTTWSLESRPTEASSWFGRVTAAAASAIYLVLIMVRCSGFLKDFEPRGPILQLAAPPTAPAPSYGEDGHPRQTRRARRGGGGGAASVARLIICPQRAAATAGCSDGAACRDVACGVSA